MNKFKKELFPNFGMKWRDKIWCLQSFNKFLDHFSCFTSLLFLHATTACNYSRGENMPNRKFNLAWFFSLKSADWSERKGEFLASFPSLKTQSEMTLSTSCRQKCFTLKGIRRWSNENVDFMRQNFSLFVSGSRFYGKNFLISSSVFRHFWNLRIFVPLNSTFFFYLKEPRRL